jgi:site-specific recombinase XerD
MRLVHDQSGIRSGAVAPHSGPCLKMSSMTSATDPPRRGASLETIRRVLGHSSITTTIRNLHVTDADLSEAIDRAFKQPDDDAQPNDDVQTA